MKKLTVYIVALFLLFTLSFSITLKVYANIADNNFRWHGNTAYFRNYNTDWSGGINNAASKYNNTDLNTSYVTTGGSYRITWYQGNYGNAFPVGRTIPYNLYGQACASFNTGGLTGNCTNSGDTRAAQLQFI